MRSLIEIPSEKLDLLPETGNFQKSIQIMQSQAVEPCILRRTNGKGKVQKKKKFIPKQTLFKTLEQEKEYIKVLEKTVETMESHISYLEKENKLTNELLSEYKHICNNQKDVIAQIQKSNIKHVKKNK